MKRAGRALAVGLFPGKQRIGVDRRTLPPALARRHLVDREMEVGAGRAGVAGVADAGDDLSAPYLLPLGESRRVGGEVRVVVHPALVGRTHIDRDPAAAVAEEQLLDRTVGG